MALPQRKEPSRPSQPSRGAYRAANDNSFAFTAANDNTEQHMAAQFNGSKNRARRQQQEYNKDPNEADRLEIEKLDTEIKQNDGNSSIAARDLGNGSIGIDLKFDVPLNPERARNISQWKANRKKFQAEGHETIPEPVLPGEERIPLSPANDNTIPVEETSASANNTVENPDETYDPYPLDEDETPDEEAIDNLQKEMDQSSEESSIDAQTLEQEAEDQQRKETEQKAEQQQVVEQVQEQEQHKREKETQKQQEQKNAEQQMAELAKQNALKEQQQQGQLLRAIQMKQKLDKKLRKLRAEKLVLKVVLYTTKVLKAIVDAIQSVVRWLASFCMSLAWTIILGILGVLLYIAYGLLFIPKGTLYATITLTEKRIKAIDTDITETKKNQQKVISMIQSLMTRRRKGSPPQDAPKFNAPQQATS